MCVSIVLQTDPIDAQEWWYSYSTYRSGFFRPSWNVLNELPLKWCPVVPGMVWLAWTTAIISDWRCACNPGTTAYDRALINFWANSVDDFSNVYVSSPADVSKSTRHLPRAPLASANSLQALAAISAASSNESGSSVGRPFFVFAFHNQNQRNHNEKEIFHSKFHEDTTQWRSKDDTYQFSHLARPSQGYCDFDAVVGPSLAGPWTKIPEKQQTPEYRRSGISW